MPPFLELQPVIHLLKVHAVVVHVSCFNYFTYLDCDEQDQDMLNPFENEVRGPTGVVLPTFFKNCKVTLQQSAHFFFEWSERRRKRDRTENGSTQNRQTTGGVRLIRAGRVR